MEKNNYPKFEYWSKKGDLLYKTTDKETVMEKLAIYAIHKYVEGYTTMKKVTRTQFYDYKKIIFFCENGEKAVFTIDAHF